MDEAGDTVTDQEGLERLACAFYQNLFTAQEFIDPELICRHVRQKITPEMASALSRPFTKLEVESDGVT